MKSNYFFFFTILVFLTGFNDLSAQDFYLAPNGVTCMCPSAAVGDTGVVNGVTYTKRTREQITDVNASTTCTSGITDMNSLFDGWTNFNEDISTWDVSNATTMIEMFQNAQSFNRDIGYWDVSSVIDMYGMFTDAYSFNKDIGNWDVSNLLFTNLMFLYALSFNQDIGSWNVSSVINMSAMFIEATSFNQDLSNWQFNSNVSLDSFIDNSGLDTNNYDLLLQSFLNQNLLNKELGAENLTYCNETARNELINNRGWIITGDTFLAPTIIAPNNLNIAPSPTNCVTTGVDLGTPIISACVIQSVTNNAPTQFPIGVTQVIWTLTDGNGIQSTDTQTVTVTLPVDIAEICYVTSDDIEVTNNRIHLYNEDGLNVDSYVVFRETSTGGVYETIGYIVPPESSFLDTSSNNNTQAYRYLINTLDVCGTTSEDSPYHKTILLQSSIAANNSINLSWNPYIGISFSTYHIYKQTNAGSYELLVSLPNTNTSYNDIEANVLTNFYKYYVSIEVANCIGAPFNSFSLKSNLEYVNPNLTINDWGELEQSIILFPNPTRSMVSVELPEGVTLKEISIVNNLGQIISKYNSKTFDIKYLATGLYYLKIDTDKGTFNKSLIKE